jgi:CheY-like chemotaxis protein
MNTIKRILFVEDSERDIELALEAFAEQHLAHMVEVARDGAEALDYLYQRGKFAGRSDSHPALVLLDIKMPRVDGLEVLRQIKTDPVLKKIPVVMMTSSREQQDLLKSYDLGVNAYVVKPVTFAEFLDSVAQLGIFWGLVNEPPPGSTPRIMTQPLHNNHSLDHS